MVRSTLQIKCIAKKLFQNWRFTEFSYWAVSCLFAKRIMYNHHIFVLQERRRRLEAEQRAADQIEQLKLEIAALKHQKPVFINHN